MLSFYKQSFIPEKALDGIRVSLSVNGVEEDLAVKIQRFVPTDEVLYRAKIQLSNKLIF